MINLSKKYALTISEAAEYFAIGEKKLRQLVAANPDAAYLLHIGTKTLIKRRLFEKYLDGICYL